MLQRADRPEAPHSTDDLRLGSAVFRTMIRLARFVSLTEPRHAWSFVHLHMYLYLARFTQNFETLVQAHGLRGTLSMNTNQSHR